MATEYWPNGQIKQMLFTKDGVLHDEFMPAKLIWHSNGQIGFAETRVNGRHVDGICLRKWAPNGSLMTEIVKSGNKYKVTEFGSEGEIRTIHYCDNKIHNDNDQPAITITYKGKLLFAEYRTNGARHRDGKPALIDERNGYVEMWYQNGMLHRNGGPAKLFKTNVRCVMEFWINGRLQEGATPAIIKMRVDGKNWIFEYQEWWANGERAHTRGVNPDRPHGEQAN